MRWSGKRGRERAHEEQVRAAVWRAQMVLAGRAIYSPDLVDADSIIGAAVEHSPHIEEALSELLTVLGANHPLTHPTLEATRASADVSLLHASWAAYCAEQARPGADETVLSMDREFPLPARVRAWTDYSAAQHRTGVLAERLAALKPQLAAVTKHDASARSRRSPA